MYLLLEVRNDRNRQKLLIEDGVEGKRPHESDRRSNGKWVTHLRTRPRSIWESGAMGGAMSAKVNQAFKQSNV